MQTEYEMRISDWSSDVCSSDLKYLLLIAALLFGLVYAAPNLYGDDPSVQISLENGDPIPADLGGKVAAAMKNAKLTPLSSGIENETWEIGRESCRERADQDVEHWVVAVSLTKKEEIT